jgi:hypothetical protein
MKGPRNAVAGRLSDYYLLLPYSLFSPPNLMDFQSRLEKAIERGRREKAARAHDAQQKALNQRELQRLFTQYRLELVERIEDALKQLADHFPGFRFEAVVNERGWGAAVSRQDLEIHGRSRKDYFSRLEVVVRPFSEAAVFELAAKGTVRNRELFHRSHYQRLTEVDTATFHEVLDLWVLEFAEAYAAEG